MIGEYDYNTLPEEIINKISNGLLFINEKGEYISAIASSWEVTNEGKEYRFHIRDGLIWSNGKQFSAEDINYNFMDIKTKIIDDKTIYFILNKPLPIFPTYLKKPITLFPLIGVAGLYKVDRIKSRYGYIRELSLSPNKKELPIIIYKFYRSESEMINAFKTGEINEIKISKKNIADLFIKWKNSTVSKTVDYARLLTLYFNLDNKLFQEKEIRQAIAMSIDREKFNEFGEMALGPISPLSWAYNPELKTPLFDKTGAKKIINKAIDASTSAQLNFYTYYDYLNNADQIVSSLKDVGLSPNLKLIASEQPSTFDFLLAYWNVPVDPDQYFYWHSTQIQGNFGGYKNVKIDKLLEDGRNTSSVAERKKHYLEFQKNIVDDPPAIFFYFPYVYTIKRK